MAIQDLTLQDVQSRLDKRLGNRTELTASERGLQASLKTLQGKKPRDVVATIDGSRAGAEPLDIPSVKDTSRVDRANATIQTTPEQPQSLDFNDFLSQSLSKAGLDDQSINDLVGGLSQMTGGKFSQAGEQVLENLLGTQVDQRDRRKESLRLQEQANLPELESELAGFESELNTITAARDSRVINETGGQTTISKRTLQNRQNEINRKYGLQVADNRINQLATIGKINAATQLIDAKLDLKYGDLEAEIDLYNSQLEAIKPFMDKEATQLAEQRQFLLTQATSEISAARESDKELELTKAQAIKNATDRGATPMQIAQIQDAQTVTDVAATGFTTTALEIASVENIYDQMRTRKDALNKAKENALEKEEAEKEEIKAETEAALLNKTFIEQIKNHEGLSSAVGFGFGKLGRGVANAIPFVNVDTEGSIGGTKKADFIKSHEQLVNSLTLENLGLMSGVLSETDIKILSGAATRLSLDLSESAYKDELNKIEKTFDRAIKENGVTPEQSKFYYGLDDSDILDVNMLYGDVEEPQEFNPANFY